MGLIKKYLLSILLIFASLPGIAQELARYNWYFGNSTSGIRFNRSTGQATKVTNQAIPFSPGLGGSSVASDNATANLFFYTDGALVYDATHQVMPLTTGLTGNTFANQPSAICAVPGQPNKYYIFTSSASFTAGGTISRLVIDMSQFGNAAFPSPPTGSGEGAVTAVPGLTNRSEGMIIVPHANGTDFWLLTQQINSQIYSATLINAATYTSGTFTTTNTSGLGLPITAANLSYQSTLKKVAVSPQDASVDAHILNFDDATGIFSFDRFILNSGLPTTTNQSIFDIEWSLTGQFLYLSRHGEPGINADVLQFDYVNTTTTLASVVSPPVFRSYGLQMAPDSAIYHLYQSVASGPFLVGKLTQTDSAASKVIYTPSPFVASDFNGKQFPSFLPKANVNLVVDFSTIGTCQNTPISFFPAVSPGADSLNWVFGDGSDTTAWSPIHTYAQAQTFNVTLTAFYKGQTQAVTKPLAITAFPLQLQLVQDTTACRSEFPPPRGTSSPQPFTVEVKTTGGTPTTFLWSNGDTGPILSPDSAGYYYVVVSDASGCSAYAGVNVKEYGLQDQRSNVWYFGNHAGIDFNTGTPVALSNSAMTAPEGCAIICDRNGKPIFYTDGDKVYNKNDVEIAAGIGGEVASSQSSIIVPVPGDETLYYIFTTQAINGTSKNELRYSLFDLKQNGGLGAVVKANVLLYSKSTERLTANGTWLISHEYGNNTFRSYPVTDQGIGNPVFSSIGSDHSFSSKENGEGYMKLGPRNNLAVALSTPGSSNLVELFHLNDTTGTLSNYRKIDLKQATGQVYGIEFSPGGNKLFATVKGTPSPSFVYEYFLDSLERPFLKQKIQNAAELGEIQIAPDGQLYIAINGSNVLGTVAADDDTTRVSSINFSGFTLASGTTSALGLPNFIQQISNATGGPNFTFLGVCLGSPTAFEGTATDAIDEFLWFFGDGGSDTQPNPTHTYAAANTYTVSMNLTNRCGLDTTLVKPVTIVPPPARPTVPGATALCNGPVTLDANTANLPGLTYDWSTGDSTKTITLNQPSFIRVTITDTNGCSSRAQSIVADNRPQLDLGPDVTICEDNSVTALDAQNTGNTYAWTVNGSSPSTTQQRVVDVTTPGIFTYQVVITDPITTCTLTEDKVFTINVSPSFTMAGIDPTGCTLANGQISLTLNASTPAGGPYAFFLTGPGGFNDQRLDQTAPGTITYNNPTYQIPAGTYSGIVSDQISGCTISQSFGLSDAPFTATAAVDPPNCDPVTVRVTSNAVALPLQYTVTNNGTGAVNGPTNAATAVFPIATPLSQGTYTIQLRDANGCVFTINNVLVTPNAPVPVTLTPSLCGNPATITASATGASPTFSWTGPGIPVGAPITTATLSIPASQSGSLTYQVVVTTTDGQCPNTQSTTVNVETPFTPNFSQSDPCATSIVVTAAPSGNYTYRWFKEIGGVPTFQPGLQGQQITLPQSEDQIRYSVSLVSTINGCVRSSVLKDVSIVGNVTAALTATPACEDDQPFMLTATTNVPASSAYAWYFNNSTTPLAGATSSTLSRTEAGTYKVEISRTICKATAQLQIIKAPLPVGVLPDRALICNDPDNLDPASSKVDLDPGSFSQYNWLRNDVSLGYTQQVYTATSEGIYKVEITNSFGCIAPDQTEVIVDCIPRIDAPNAFRPSSGSTANKDFYMFTFFITDQFQVFIYNRWGELFYQSNDRNFKWNGTTLNGQPAQSETYTYVVKYISAFRPEKGVQEKRGSVVLLR